MSAPVVEAVRAGVVFVPAAAASFRRVEASLGRRVTTNSTYRDYNLQLRMFNAWNAYVSGRGPYPGHSRAIHPDMSAHCRGLALDTDDWALRGFIPLMAEHGWVRTAANDPTERHHFEYQSWRDQHRTAPAGGGAVLIPDEPKRKKQNMAVLFNRNGEQLWALAGTSPGTSANWIEMTDTTVVNKLVSQQFGDGAVKLTPPTWDAWKARYLEPTTGAGVAFDYAELGKALALAVSANAPVPSAADIARAVNDDAAERLRN